MTDRAIDLCRCLLVRSNIYHTQLGQAVVPSPFIGNIQRAWVHQEPVFDRRNSRLDQRDKTRVDKVDEPITPEPRLANFPVGMRQDVISMYGDCRRKVMQTVDEIEAACEMPVQHKHLFIGRVKEMDMPRSKISRSRRSGWGMRSITLSVTSIRLGKQNQE